MKAGSKLTIGLVAWIALISALHGVLNLGWLRSLGAVSAVFPKPEAQALLEKCQKISALHQ